MFNVVVSSMRKLYACNEIKNFITLFQLILLPGRVRALGDQSWVCLDFGTNGRVLPSAIALRHGGHADIAAVSDINCQSKVRYDVDNFQILAVLGLSHQTPHRHRCETAILHTIIVLCSSYLQAILLDICLQNHATLLFCCKIKWLAIVMHCRNFVLII